jgi:hypothetical protein
MPTRGIDMANKVGIAALMLNLEFTPEQKAVLFSGLMQFGIDNYGIINNGGKEIWKPGEVNTGGRKLPIIMAGHLLGNDDMARIGDKSGDYLYSDPDHFWPGKVQSDYIHFGEDDQTFYVTQRDIGLVHTAPSEQYIITDLKLPEWGIMHATVPTSDNRAWTVPGRDQSAVAWSGILLAARIMLIADIMYHWNHDALFDYLDRYMAVTASADSTPEWRYTVPGMDAIWGTNTGNRSMAGFGFIEKMWDAYRGKYNL